MKKLIFIVFAVCLIGCASSGYNAPYTRITDTNGKVTNYVSDTRIMNTQGKTIGYIRK
jgi:hypothetical protein